MIGAAAYIECSAKTQQVVICFTWNYTSIFGCHCKASLTSMIENISDILM